MHNAIQELRGMASEELITIAMLSTYSFKLQLAVVPSQQTNQALFKPKFSFQDQNSLALRAHIIYHF